jgi:hypothetical protein
MLMVSAKLCSNNRLTPPYFASFAVAALVFVTAVACDRGPRLVKLDGSVQVDGKPTGGVTLLFFDQQSSMAVASARSEEDGSFTPTTEMKPGIPEGKYRVVASWPDPKFVAPKTSMGQSPPEPPDLLNGRYALGKTDVLMDASAASPKAVVELKTK